MLEVEIVGVDPLLLVGGRVMEMEGDEGCWGGMVGSSEEEEMLERLRVS